MPRVSKKQGIPRKASNNPARDMKEVNKTAQMILGNPRKSWMDAAKPSIPPQQQDSANQEILKSGPQISVVPKTQHAGDIEHMADIVDSDHMAAKQDIHLQQNVRPSTTRVNTSEELDNSYLNTPLLADVSNSLPARKSMSSQHPFSSSSVSDSDGVSKERQKLPGIRSSETGVLQFSNSITHEVTRNKISPHQHVLQTSTSSPRSNRTEYVFCCADTETPPTTDGFRMVGQARLSKDTMLPISSTTHRNLKRSSTESQSLLDHIGQDLKRLRRLLGSYNGAENPERQLLDNDNEPVEIEAQSATPPIGSEERVVRRSSLDQTTLSTNWNQAESNSCPQLTEASTSLTANGEMTKLNGQQYTDFARISNRDPFKQAVSISRANAMTDSSISWRMKNTSSGIPSMARQSSPKPRTQMSENDIPTLLSLKEFVEASGQLAATMWTHLLVRLQAKIEEVSTTASEALHRSSQLQWLADVQSACLCHDTKYLLMFQTFAIMQSSQTRVFINDRVLSAGLEYLRELFDYADEEERLWATNFPCAHPGSRLLLDQWLQILHPGIQTIVNDMNALSNTCSTLGRPPLISEIDNRFWASRRIQMAVLRSLLTRNWLPPLDRCFEEILRAFVKGLNQMQKIRSIAPSTTQFRLIETERQKVDAEVMGRCREHERHIMSASGVQLPNSLVFTSPNSTSGDPVRLGFWNQPSQQHGPAQTYPNASPSLHQSIRSSLVQVQPRMSQQLIMSSQQNYSARRAPARIQSMQTRSEDRRQIVQQSPRSAFAPSQTTRPTQRNQNQWNNKQAMTAVPHRPTPRITQNCQPLALHPSPSSSHASKHGNSMYQAHLQDPVNVPTHLKPNQHPYRAYVAEFFESTPLYFTSKEPIQTLKFEVPKAAFAKLAIQNEDEKGGPPRRAINSTTQIVRIRGVIIKPPNTFSEWYTTETNWPKHIAVFLNDQSIEFRRKPLYAKDLAVDVTSRIRPGYNSLAASFLWGNAPPADFHYALALERVVIVDITVLSIEIKFGEQSNTEEQLKHYFEQQSDNEVEMMLDHLDISLLDPYTSQMPPTPVRTAHCMHFQCFDLDIFLQTRPRDINKADHFICPLCGNDARPGNLRVDYWMSQVLQKLKDDDQGGAKVIRVLPDLTWVVKEVVQTENDGRNMHLQQTVPKTDLHLKEIIELD